MEREKIDNLREKDIKIKIVLSNTYSFSGKIIEISRENNKGEFLVCLSDKDGNVSFSSKDIVSIQELKHEKQY